MGQALIVSEDNVITLGLAALGLINGWTLWLVQSARAERKELQQQIADQRQDLAKFKIEVAQTHVTVGMLQQVETRVVDAIKNLGDRIDRVFEQRKPNG